MKRRSNNHRRSCLSYIASVLRDAGTPVELPEPEAWTAQPATDDHRELHAKGLVKIGDLDSALGSLRKVDALYRQYREVSDRVGTVLARELVGKGEHRAKAMAANVRLSRRKRSEKQEIAKCFKVWLEVPDLFYDWLEMRQNSQEFQKAFPHFNSRSWRHEGKRSFSI